MKKKAEQLDPAELARREEQRQKRAIALEKRAAGGTYTSAKSLKRKLRKQARLAAAAAGAAGAGTAVTVAAVRGGRGGGRGSAPSGRASDGGGGFGPVGADGGGRGRGRGAGDGRGRGGGRSSQTSGTEEGGGAPPPKPDLVIIPIYWKAHKEDKIRVVTAARAAHAAINAAGLRCEIDLSFDKTPGQKFASWEFQGVLTRVEIGPRDADQGTCTLARTDAPGTPARRKAGVSTRADALVTAVRALLAGGDAALAELSAYAGPVEAKGGKGKRARGAAEDAPPAEGEPPEALVGIGPAAAGAGGDDLPAVDAQPESADAGMRSRKGKKARAEVVF